MSTSLGGAVRCVGAQRGRTSSVLKTGRVGNRAATLSFAPKRVARQRRQAILAVAAEVIRSVPEKLESGRRGRAAREKLDHWMRDSVVEIVKNLGAGDAAAPLLVQVYGGDCGTRVRMERATAGDWDRIKGRWRSGEEPSPDGIMLVEELKDEVEMDVGSGEGNLGNSVEGQGQNGENTKAWGVLLMGKGEEGRVASYLLKTTRRGSQSHRGGLSCDCTHFSLVKVKSFRETTRSQLTNSWLVQANYLE